MEELDTAGPRTGTADLVMAKTMADSNSSSVQLRQVEDKIGDKAPSMKTIKQTHLEVVVAILVTITREVRVVGKVITEHKVMVSRISVHQVLSLSEVKVADQVVTISIGVLLSSRDSSIKGMVIIQVLMGLVFRW